MVKTENPVSELGLESAEMGEEANFQELGKAEFFDSQPWLDSDCEDFFSVNGDSTPIHPKNSMKNSLHDKAPASVHDDPSPNIMKKQLFELFCESFNRTADVNGYKDSKAPPNLVQTETSGMKSLGELVQKSSPGSEATSLQEYSPRKQKSSQSGLCCIPGLARSLKLWGPKEEAKLS